MLLRLRSDLKQFILTKNKIGSNVIRGVLSIISNEGLDDSVEDEKIINIIKKEIKKRKEAIKLYSENNREDLSRIESDEMGILSSYIPEQMSESLLRKEIEAIKVELEKQGNLNLGELIKLSIKTFSSSADNSVISKIAKDLIK